MWLPESCNCQTPIVNRSEIGPNSKLFTVRLIETQNAAQPKPFWSNSCRNKQQLPAPPKTPAAIIFASFRQLPRYNKVDCSNTSTIIANVWWPPMMVADKTAKWQSFDDYHKKKKNNKSNSCGRDWKLLRRCLWWLWWRGSLADGSVG